jgi:hypothetical protein
VKASPLARGTAYLPRMCYTLFGQLSFDSTCSLENQPLDIGIGLSEAPFLCRLLFFPNTTTNQGEA